MRGSTFITNRELIINIDFLSMILFFYRKCLVQGLFMNSAELQRDGTYLTVSQIEMSISHFFAIFKSG